MFPELSNQTRSQKRKNFKVFWRLHRIKVFEFLGIERKSSFLSCGCLPSFNIFFHENQLRIFSAFEKLFSQIFCGFDCGKSQRFLTFHEWLREKIVHAKIKFLNQRKLSKWKLKTGQNFVCFNLFLTFQTFLFWNMRNFESKLMKNQISNFLLFQQLENKLSRH